jgi:uncharacterized protein (TIGR02246 family)
MADGTRAVIEQFHEAINAHDLQRLADLCTDDCVFEDTSPPDGVRSVGRDEVMAAFREFFAQSPNARFVHEELVVTGDRGFLTWRYDWGDGHVRGVDLIRVRDGQVSETFAYVKG